MAANNALKWLGRVRETGEENENEEICSVHCEVEGLSEQKNETANHCMAIARMYAQLLSTWNHKPSDDTKRIELCYDSTLQSETISPSVHGRLSCTYIAPSKLRNTTNRLQIVSCNITHCNTLPIQSTLSCCASNTNYFCSISMKRHTKLNGIFAITDNTRRLI